MSSGRGALLEFFVPALAVRTLPALLQTGSLAPTGSETQPWSWASPSTPAEPIAKQRLIWGCPRNQALPPHQLMTHQPQQRKAPIVAWGPSCRHKHPQVLCPFPETELRLGS